MTSMGHDRKKKDTHIPFNQDGGSVQVVTRKLDLDQTSMARTHSERHIRDQLSFRLQISLWMILMIFVTQNSS